MPVSGPGSAVLRALSAASACLSAMSSVTRRNALTSGSRLLIRSRWSTASSEAEISRSRSSSPSSLMVSLVGSKPLRLFLDGRHAEESVDLRRRVREDLRLRKAWPRLVLAQGCLDLDDLRRGRYVLGVELLQAVDRAEDAAQLVGVELLVAGLEVEA